MEPRDRGRDRRDPEHALVLAVRWAALPTLGAPFGCAALASSAAGQGLPLALAAPLAALALVVSATCWVKVIALWRALPQGDDDDQDWWDRRRGDTPLDPTGGGGINFDWAAFERQFWSYVDRFEHERARVRELTHAYACPPIR
jgi:hypothetical protein